MKPIFQPSDCLSTAEIKNYVQNESTSAAERRVEEHILDCPLCADAVDGFEMTGADPELTFAFDFAAVAAEPKATQKEAKVVQMQPRRTIWRQLAVAATLLILVSAGFFFLNSPSDTALYSDFYQPYSSDLLISMRSESDNAIDADLERAMIAYEEGKFADSLPYFKKTLATKGDDALANFYAGMAYLETGNTADAIPALEKVYQQKGKYYQAATWYLALAHLKNGAHDKAKKMTKSLLTTGTGAYLEKAQKLNAKL